MKHRWVALIGLLIGIVPLSSSIANALPFTRTSILSLTATAAWPCALPGDLNCDCDVDVVDIMLVASRSNVDWLEFEPLTLLEEENYRGKTKTYPLGPRTLYLDNLRLVRVIGP